MFARSADRIGPGIARPVHRAIRQVDARASHCPGPVMETIRLVRESEIGETVAVLASGSDAAEGIAAWVERTGHTLAAVEGLPDGRRYLITRAR